MDGNLEFVLLTRVIDTGDYRTLEKARIDDTYFNTPGAKEVFYFLRDTYHNQLTFGMVPNRETVQQVFPAFFPQPSGENVAVLALRLKQERLRIEIQLLGQDLINRAELSPLEALAALRAQSANLSALTDESRDYSLAGSVQLLKDRYRLIQQTGGLLGIPFPWEPLNSATHGLQPGNFFLIYGRPKSMKTWVGLYIAVYAYMFARRRVLVYSKEMTYVQLLTRMSALVAEIDYKAYTDGKLQPELLQRLWGRMDQLQDDEVYAGSTGNRQPQLIISEDEGEDGGGVGWLKTKVEELDIDLVVADSIYLMKDDRARRRDIDWKNVTHISQDMKRAAKGLQIPIIGITQQNRESEKWKSIEGGSAEIAHADAFGQDTDGVMRVKRNRRIDPNLKCKVTELDITMPLLREGLFDGMVIHGIPATNFGYIRPLAADQEEEIDGQPAGEKAPVGPKPRPRLQPRSLFRPDGSYRDPIIPIIR